jgi:soluble lytic murein transglycosylase-like protein
MFDLTTTGTNINLSLLQFKAQSMLLRQIWKRLESRLQSDNPHADLDSTGISSSTDFDELIERAARKHGVDPKLVKSVIKVESNFDPTAVSSAGAKGLMQLMDATAADLGVHDSFNVAENIEGGVTYLAQQLSRFHGDVRLALAAYNAGPNAVLRSGGVPPIPETVEYVSRVLSHYTPIAANQFDISI